MKKTYTLYALCLAFVLASAALLAYPPTSVFACTGSASCANGGTIWVPDGATSCNCTDNEGCKWTKGGKKYKQNCAGPGPEEDDLLD
jgi:hypothetical protein